MLITDIDEEQEEQETKYRRKSRFLFFVVPFLIIVLIVGFYNAYKMTPLGLDTVSEKYVVNESDIQFLFDNNYLSPTGTTSSQEIFDTMFKYIDQANQYILIDAFLFNDWVGQGTVERNLTSELANHLLAKKQANPDIKIDFITDPINTAYGGSQNQYLEKLANAGVSIIITDLKPLPDSNPWYSAWWRTLIMWFSNGDKYGWLPQPFSSTAPKVSLRSYLSMLNFKANHRKVMIADNNGQLISLISSANPHDASSANSNTAVIVRGRLAEAIYQSETAVAKMSKRALFSLPENLINKPSPEANKFARISLATENKIKQAILDSINKLQAKDEIKIAMFYLSDRDIIKALIACSKKSVTIKIILDSNQNAFGYQKIGIPNLATAKELITKSRGVIQIKWAKSNGEQFHSKMFTATNKADKLMTVFVGSANLTRRNLANYNLEADALIELNTDWDQAQIINNYFNKLWTGAAGESYTDDYKLHNDVPWWLSVASVLQEFTGLSSF